MDLQFIYLLGNLQSMEKERMSVLVAAVVALVAVVGLAIPLGSSNTGAQITNSICGPDSSLQLVGSTIGGQGSYQCVTHNTDILYIPQSAGDMGPGDTVGTTFQTEYQKKVRVSDTVPRR